MPACSESVRLSPRPRKFDVWNDSWPKKPSNCETPAPNVSWLRFCSSSFSLTSTLFVSFGVFWTSTSFRPRAA